MNKNFFRLAAVAAFAWGTAGNAAPPVLELAGPNPFTNECHTPYVEPGLWVKGAPVKLAAGVAHSLALKADGTVVTWGLDQLGLTNVPANLGRAIDIAAAGYFSLAVTEAGAVVGWGDGPYGELNIPAAAQQEVVAVAAGRYHVLALKRDGTLVAWGNNGGGQLNIPASATNLVAIAAGGQHSLALRADGSLVEWGYSFDGMSGIPPGATNIVAISDSGVHRLALRADGTVFTWGYEDQFHLLRVPARATNVIAVAAQDKFSVALRADGTVVTWGLDEAARITVIPPGATNIIGIAAGGEFYFADYCLAWQADGSVVGWGANSWGQTIAPPGLGELELPSYVTGDVDTDTPGIYPLTYTTTNILGETGTATRTVFVVDTTPPELNCPTNQVLELTDTGGATASFVAKAADLCAGILPVTFAPASGSKFPVGTNIVVATAGDAAGNRVQCHFTVTILGARTVKANVRAEMTQAATSQHSMLLDHALRSLTRSLDADWWQDEMRLAPKSGRRVFQAEAETVLLLEALQKQRRHQIPPATLQDWIVRLVKVDRVLAERQIEIWAAAGAAPKQLAEATEMLSRGDQATRQDRDALAIAFYERAWAMAVNRPTRFHEEIRSSTTAPRR